jgi:hypothetical protein
VHFLQRGEGSWEASARRDHRADRVRFQSTCHSLSVWGQTLTTLKLTNLALYETAKWAVPLLKENAVEDRSPSLLVTSTTQLWREPVPALVALSMVKSAQRALVLSLNSHYGNDIHIGLVSVGGVVDPDKKNLSPDNIAEQAYALYRQPRDKWEREIEISDDE